MDSNGVLNKMQQDVEVFYNLVFKWLIVLNILVDGRFWKKTKWSLWHNHLIAILYNEINFNLGIYNPFRNDAFSGRVFRNRRND